ncbi:MAG: hypothetical protein GXP62_04335 [Oligoflexia bacterium]|nr:hypothetical protein [Oligoflexia bacterium]
MSVLQQTQRTSNLDSQDLDASVTGGDTVSSTGRGNAAAQGQVDRSQRGRNPGNYNDSAGNATTHTPVDIGEATGGPAERPPDYEPGEREVRAFYTEDDPLSLNGTPTTGTLYEERPSTGECVDDWVVATGIMGSVEQPSVLSSRDESTIFIDGAPAVADIHQGWIGDCYFLAAVTDIAQSDPGHLRGMFTVSGNQVVVKLFSYDPAAGNWQPRNISVDMSFLHATDAQGSVADLMSSGFRMGDTPSGSEWYASVSDGDDLWVCENATYELALWAPLLEKAYARLAERFGQYGGAHSGDANSNTNADGSARSGYEIIDGGFEQYCYGLLYGSDEVSNSSTAIDYAADATGAELVAINLPLLEQMLKLDGTDVPAGQQAYMTLAIDSGTIVGRLLAQLDRTLALRGVNQYASFVRSLQWVRALCAHYQTAEAANDQAAVDSAANDITAACTRMAAPDSWPILGSGRADGAYQDLRDLVQVAQNIGTDASDGRRLTYADHAYAVLGVSLRDKDNNDLTLTGADLHARVAEIDPDKSSVRLRNPHGTNEPDADGDGADDGTDEGIFSMPLQQALRVFSESEQAIVRT